MFKIFKEKVAKEKTIGRLHPFDYDKKFPDL